MTTEEQGTTATAEPEPTTTPPESPPDQPNTEYEKRLAELDKIDDPAELRERAIRAGQAATRSRQKESGLRKEIAGLREYLDQRLGPPKPEGGEGGEDDEDDLPDPSVDPVGHLKAYIDQRIGPIEETAVQGREEAKRRAEAERQAREWQKKNQRDKDEFLSTLVTEVFDGDEEKAKTDYDQAALWWMTERVEAKLRAHPQLDETQAEQLVIAEDLMGTHGIFSDPDTNRAYALYKAALERGWQPGTIFYDPGADGSAEGGSTPALTPPPTDARERLRAEREGGGSELGMPASAGDSPPGSRTKLGDLLNDPQAFKREREKYPSMTDFLRAHGKLT